MMKIFSLWFLSLVLLSACSSTPPAQSVYEKPLVRGWSFDWDDNIFFMPDRIYLKHKKTGKPASVSTHEFALVREQIGKEGKYRDFVIAENGYADFSDSGKRGEGQFSYSVQRAMKEKGTAWQGPSWRAFLIATANQESADQTTVITARRHAPKSMHSALTWMKSAGHIQAVPPKENLYPVGYPKLEPAEFRGSSSSPSEAKAHVMLSVLDKFAKVPLPKDATSSPTLTHSWGFSDDDLGNFDAAMGALAPPSLKNRWPKVRLVLYFTGTNKDQVPPHIAVLVPGQKPRPPTEGEATPRLEEALAVWVKAHGSTIENANALIQKRFEEYSAEL